jgi:hypothetical protein
MELDHRRAEASTTWAGPSGFGTGSTGHAGRVRPARHRDAFLLAVQPHTWRGDRYKGVDGGTARPNENQASQVLVVTGLPR